jgi:hypothetical protein
MADAKDEEAAATAAMTTYVDGHAANISAIRNHAKSQNRLDLSNSTKLESVVVLPEKDDTPERIKVARARMRMFTSRKLRRRSLTRATANRDQGESDTQAGRSSPPPFKRRQSLLEHENNSAKRQRLNDGGNEDPTDRSSKTQDNPTERRRSYMDDERGRAKRMFGALSNTLAQSRTRVTPAEKRRSEIEQKQRAKLRQEAEELAAQRRRRLAELRKQREREQWDYDREAVRYNAIALEHGVKADRLLGQMHAKHANEITRAQFLFTRVEPTLVSSTEI